MEECFLEVSFFSSPSWSPYTWPASSLWTGWPLTSTVFWLPCSSPPSGSCLSDAAQALPGPCIPTSMLLASLLPSREDGLPWSPFVHSSAKWLPSWSLSNSVSEAHSLCWQWHLLWLPSDLSVVITPISREKPKCLGFCDSCPPSPPFTLLFLLCSLFRLSPSPSCPRRHASAGSCLFVKASCQFLMTFVGLFMPCWSLEICYGGVFTPWKLAYVKTWCPQCQEQADNYSPIPHGFYLAPLGISYHSHLNEFSLH